MADYIAKGGPAVQLEFGEKAPNVEKKRLEIDDEAAEIWTLLAREMLPFRDSNPHEYRVIWGLGSRPPGRSRLEEKNLAD